MPFVIDKFKSKNGASVSEEFVSKASVSKDVKRIDSSVVVHALELAIKRDL